MSTSTRRGRMAAILVALAVAGAAGCDPGSAAPGSPDGGVGNTFPVTVTNCDRAEIYEQAPSHVVTGNRTVLETLIALDVVDHVSGYLSGDLAPLPVGAGDLAEVSPQYHVPREVLLAARPDLVIVESAGQLSGEGGTATPEDLGEAGAKTFVMQGNCGDGDGARTLEQIYVDIEQLGAIFGAADRAETLVADLRGRVGAVDQLRGEQEPATVAFVQVYDEQLYALGGSNYDTVLSGAGLVNEFADLTTYFAPISSEEALVLDPGFFFVAYQHPETPEQALDGIRELLGGSAAVTAGNLLAVPSHKLGAGGVSLIDVVEQAGQAVYG